MMSCTHVGCWDIANDNADCWDWMGLVTLPSLKSFNFAIDPRRSFPCFFNVFLPTKNPFVFTMLASRMGDSTDSTT